MWLTGAGGRAGGRAVGSGDTASVPAVAERAGGSRPGSARGGLELRWAVPVALAGGLALAAAFPPVGVWPLAIAGPALLTVALWRRRLRASLVVGLVFGAAFFVPLISWLVNVAWYVWAALAVAQMVSFAVLAVGQRLLLRLRAWPLAVAGWWVAAESVRDRWPYAFPWGRLAMSQASAPTARWVAVGGAPLLTFLLALAGACLAWLLLGPSQRTEQQEVASRRQQRPPALHGRALPALAFAGAAGLALAGRAASGGPGHSRWPCSDRRCHSGGCAACAEPA